MIALLLLCIPIILFTLAIIVCVNYEPKEKDYEDDRTDLFV